MEKLKILAAGDIHGDIGIAKKLAKKGKKEKVDLVILAGDIHGYFEQKNILKPFEEKKQKIIFIPGNWDFDEDIESMVRFGKNIHNYYVSYKGVGIAGIGSPNWKMSLKKEDMEFVRKNFSKMSTKKKVLVSHLHPAQTLSEFSGFPGEKVLTDVIKEFSPDLLISAHIHEAAGIEDIVGKTRIVQVGRKGTIITI